MTPRFGRIRVFARAAARSRKRFGGCFDGVQTITGQLKVPRESSTENFGSEGSPLWTIESADLKEMFPQWRLNYGTIENLFFVLRFIQDIVPEAHSDPDFYQGVLEFFRISESKNLFKNPTWWKAAFWTWAASYFGFGSLLSPLVGPLYAAHPKWPEFWGECLFQKKPDLKRLIQGFDKLNPIPLTLADDLKLFEEWLKLSSIQWDYFDKWIRAKQGIQKR